jgi:hypothetical protein
VALLHAQGIITATTALCAAARTDALIVLDSIPASDSRAWLMSVCNPDSSPSLS